MRILHLSLNNFFSFKSAEFDFRDKSDLIFVSGLNGAGKSALFVEAIPWAIYGNTIREKVYGSTSREFSKDDVVNESEGKDCCVSIGFSVGTTPYSIFRYRNHSEYGNRVFLYEELFDANECSYDNVIHGFLKDISGESTKETNQKIIDLIGLNYSAYCNAVVFGQGTIKRFTQCTDAERRNILEDFLQLEIYTTAREIAKKDWKRLIETVSELTSERDICNARISEIQSQCTWAKGKVKDAQNELTNYDFSVKADLKIKTSRLVRIKNELQEISKALEDLDSVDVDDALQQIQEQQKELQPLDEAEDLRTESYYALASLNKSIHEWEEAQNRFSVGDDCPSCFRKLTKPAFTKYVDFLSTKISAARIKRGEIEEIFEEAAAIVKLLRELHDQEVKMTQTRQELDHKREREEASRKSLLEESKRIKAEISKAEDRSDGLAMNLEKAEEEVKKLTRLTGFLENVERVKNDRIEEVRKEADEAKFWMDGFSNKGVKDLIFAQSLGYLNDKLTRYATAISGGTINVQIHRDLSVGVDITEGAKRYQTASGGQARRIDLMIGLALQSLVEAGWQDVNVKFIDEFDASLDKAGVDGFLQLLREESKQKSAIFIISHNDYLAKQLDQVINVELVNGQSQII